MGETLDPHAALDSKSVAERSAGARDLAHTGTFDDLERLVAMAKGEKSSAVRLYAAAACADIVHRYRGLPGGPTLDAAQLEQIHLWVRSYDPGSNPSLLMLLSALTDDAALSRLGRMLRDPRNNVRAGAAAALRRMSLSAVAIQRTNIAPAVDTWLQDKRMPPDVIYELVRLVGEAGWPELAGSVRAVSVQGRQIAEAVQTALARLEERRDPATWEGAWKDSGTDIFETTDTPRGVGIRIVCDGLLSDGARSHVVTLGEGPMAKVAGTKAPMRLVWSPRMGEAEERHPAIQQANRTWWKVQGRDLANLVDELVVGFTDNAAVAMQAVATWLEAVEGIPAARARAVAIWKAGDADAALDLIEPMMKGKRPKNELFWWLGRFQADRGEKKIAKAALAQFLEKAGKKAAWRSEAESLLAELG